MCTKSGQNGSKHGQIGKNSGSEKNWSRELNATSINVAVFAHAQ